MPRKAKTAALLAPAAEEPTPDFSGEKVLPLVNPFELLPPMIERLRELQRRVAACTEALEEAQAELTDYSQRVLPDAMQFADLAEFKTRDGTLLKLKDDVKASITEANRTAAHAWLRAHGHGGVIKTVYEVDARAMQGTEREDDFMQAMEELGLEAIPKEAIHYQTLQALVRELLEAGTTLPPAISVFQFKRAELKEPKAKG